MTDRIALVLILIIIGAIGLDLYQGWGATLFVLKKGVDLIEWIKFWN
ncbi:MAG: hypothetical protein OEM24_10200 [Paracoccaceae bacterium]|nr:hypothetical protein [Paracoccaceae bacterium]